MENEIMHYIKKNGISSRVKGFKYLTDGIEMAISDRDILEAVTKELYPAIAKKNNSSATGVEKAIRHAIKTAWHHGYFQSMENQYCSRRYLTTQKPTNSEFIAVAADLIRLDRKAV